MPEVDGLRPLPARIANKYVDQVLAAAESDIVVAEQFARVIGFLGPPTRRVATTNSAGGKATTQPPDRSGTVTSRAVGNPIREAFGV